MTRQGNMHRASESGEKPRTNLTVHRTNSWQFPVVFEEDLKSLPFRERYVMQPPRSTSSSLSSHDLDELSSNSHMDLKERKRASAVQHQKGYNLLLPTRSPSSSVPSSTCGSPQAISTPCSFGKSASAGTSSSNPVASAPVLETDSLSELIMFPEISAEWKPTRPSCPRPRHHPSNDLNSSEFSGVKSFISSWYSGSYLSSPASTTRSESRGVPFPSDSALVAIDDGNECVEALEYALSHGLFKNTRNVTLFTVLQPLHYVPQGLANPSMALAWSENLADRVLEAGAREHCQRSKDRRRKTLNRLEEVRNILKDEKQIMVELQIVEKPGPPGRHIVEAAMKMDAQTLIMGRCKCSRIIRTLTMEGISDYCISKAPNSIQVVAVRRRKRGGYLVSDKNKTDFWVLA